MSICFRVFGKHDGPIYFLGKSRGNSPDGWLSEVCSTLQCLSNFLSYSVRTWKLVENHHSLAGKLGCAEPGNLGTIWSVELSFATPKPPHVWQCMRSLVPWSFICNCWRRSQLEHSFAGNMEYMEWVAPAWQETASFMERRDKLSTYFKAFRESCHQSKCSRNWTCLR